jgi:hypothetical protein
MTARRWWSQSGEDKIAAAIFREIGTVNETAVEFGALDGWHNSNTAHFRQLGWTTHLFDSGPLDPMVTHAVITAENVNDVFAATGVPEEFDLLSIDIDGNDLWVWKALQYRPRVVIMEYNPLWGLKKSRTVPYDPERQWDGTVFYGASLRALTLLGAQKGYDLVAATRSNLIFAPHGTLPPLDVTTIPPSRKVKRPDPAERKWEIYR